MVFLQPCCAKRRRRTETSTGAEHVRRLREPEVRRRSLRRPKAVRAPRRPEARKSSRRWSMRWTRQGPKRRHWRGDWPIGPFGHSWNGTTDDGVRSWPTTERRRGGKAIPASLGRSDLIGLCDAAQSVACVTQSELQRCDGFDGACPGLPAHDRPNPNGRTDAIVWSPGHRFNSKTKMKCLYAPFRNALLLSSQNDRERSRLR